MVLETRANVILCFGFLLAIVQNTNRFNILELSMISLSCFTVFFFSFISCKLVNEPLYRIQEKGIPCCLLLPLIYTLSNVTGEERFIYSIFYNGMILTSLIPLVQTLSIEQPAPNFWVMGCFGFITSLSYWLVLLITKIDILTSLVIILHLMVLWLMQKITPKYLPGSFTFGELTILIQGVTSFLLNMIVGFSPSMWFSFRSPGSVISTSDILIFSQTAGLCCALFVITILFQSWFRLNIVRIVFLLAIIMPLAWIIFNKRLSKDLILWLIQAVFKSKTSICLLMYWSICMLAAILLTLGSSSNIHKKNAVKDYKRSATTKIRKLFHILITLVYLPGVLLDQELLYIASVVATVVMIIAESIRFFNIPPIGEVIRLNCSAFLDDQDKGLVILTPLYLLIGCSSSLWLSVGQDLSKIFPLVGLLSLGIGDSSASYFGSKYGKFHWKDSPKSMEGTLACIVSQGAVVILLQSTGLEIIDPSTILPWKLIVAVTLSSLYESFTTQIDNLVLPLFFYLLIC